MADNRNVYRFDGQAFEKVYTAPKPIVSYASKGNVAWIALADGRLLRGGHPGLGGAELTQAPPFPRGHHLPASVSSQGVLFVRLVNELLRVDRGRVQTVKLPPSLAAANVEGLAHDGRGALLIASRAGLWQVAEDGEATSLFQGSVSAVAHAPDDETIYFCNDDTLFVRARDGHTQAWPLPSLVKSCASLAVDARSVWTVPHRGEPEVVRLDRRDGRLTGSVRLPLAVPVSETVVDLAGSLWLAHPAGVVSQIHETLAAPLPLAEGIRPPIFALLEDDQGGLWYSTVGSLVHRTPEGNTEHLAQRHPALTCTRSVAQPAKGEIVAATCDHGLAWFRGGDLDFLDTQHGLAQKQTKMVLASGDGGVWVGFTGGGIQHITRTVADSPIPGFTAVVTAMALSEKTGLWLGTEDGVYQWHQDRLTHHDETRGLSDPSIRSLAVLATDWVAAGTRQGGLFVFDGTRWRALGEPEAPFPAEAVFGILSRGPRTWFTSGNGVFSVLTRDLEAHLTGQGPLPESLHVGVEDGLQTPRCGDGALPSITSRAEGGIWIPTIGGVYAITEPEPPARAHLEITELRVDGQALALTQGHLQVPAHAERIQLDVAMAARSAYHHDLLEVAWSGGSSWSRVPADKTLTLELPRARRTTLDLRLRSALAPDETLYKTQLAFERRSVLAQPTVWISGLLTVTVAALALTFANAWRARRRFTVVLNERNRIARDLHDSLAQGFAALGYALKRLSRSLPEAPKAEALAGEMEELLKGVRLEARHAIWNLRSHGLAQRDLGHALKELAEQARLASGVEVTVDTRVSRKSFSETLESNLLKIAQEAISNALVHGKASKVTISLRDVEDKIELAVEDDGIGFRSVPRTTGHFGMVGMAERAEQLGGCIEVDKDRARGALIRVLVPFRYNRTQEVS